MGEGAAFVSAGGYHAAVLDPDRAALADALRRLARAGVPLDGAADRGVSEALYLRGPGGTPEGRRSQRRRAVPRPARGRAATGGTAARRKR